jgi:hypothetical protein
MSADVYPCDLHRALTAERLSVVARLLSTARRDITRGTLPSQTGRLAQALTNPSAVCKKTTAPSSLRARYQTPFRA